MEDKRGAKMSNGAWDKNADILVIVFLIITISILVFRSGFSKAHFLSNAKLQTICNSRRVPQIKTKYFFYKQRSKNPLLPAKYLYKTSDH